MWIKFLFFIIFFYFLGVVQNSFFAHFNILGITPNFILIFFFLFTFFAASKNAIFSWQDLFLSITAGLFLDMFSYDYFGVHIILLLIISFFVKKSFSLLREGQERQPIAYFVPLFILSLIFYSLFLSLSSYFFEGLHFSFNFNWAYFVGIIYNLAFAVLFFYIFKKNKLFSGPSRQLKLLP